MPSGRNGGGQPISTPGLHLQELTFANGTAYTTYRLVFPILKNAGNTNSMQIGEVRLLPEPATLALLGLGVIGVAARRRRG